MYFGFSRLLYPLATSSVLTQSSGSGSTNPVEASSTTDVPPAVPTICGDIIRYANQNLEQNFVFEAESVYQCLTSVPFLDVVATRFIEYYNTTMQFQSTLAYLKDPPPEYQQPAVDVISVLREIQNNITIGHYKNQYDFEATVQALVYSMHDSHVNLASGILSAFSFGSPYDIMSLSVDGKQAPRVWIKDDIVDSSTQGWTPSPIESINGEDVAQYLKRFAALNSFGLLEPNADWNQLMFNPVQDILGTYNVFGWEATFYPGKELVFKFANGTTLDTVWLGFYRNFQQTGPLATGGDFYNYFVLGLLPASFVDTDNAAFEYTNATDTDSGDNSGDSDGSDDNDSDDDDSVPTQTSWNQDSSAFPVNPDIVQPGLSVAGNGFLTGYFFRDISTGVLSLPSFDEFGDSIGDFSNTTSRFIRGAKDAGLTRIVIDLQQNTGGATLLAVDTFKQFFPNLEPFAGSRRRSHYLANILGGAMTDFWGALTPDGTTYDYDDYYEPLAASEWVITDRLNAATGQNFTSWQEYSGPVPDHNDLFSLTERYNLSSHIFDADAFGGWIPAGYSGGNSGQKSPPWKAQDIVLLTDGLCGSTCSLFVELMVHQAGARTIVAGGRPQTGPMQAASGSRGASAYTADFLDADFVFAGLVNDTANTTLPQVRDPGMYTFTLGFNLRDQVRQNDPVPLQFHYEAAHCRIYYTLANALNMTRLWRDAAAATWDDPSLCVQDSTGYARSGNATSTKPAPTIQSGQVMAFDGVQSAVEHPWPDNFDDSILQDPINKKQSGSFGACNPSTCASNKCASVKCPSGNTIRVCQPPCDNPGGRCAGGQGNCVADTKNFESKAQTSSGQSDSFGHENFHRGFCVPKKNYRTGCSNAKSPTVPQ